jgi:hypothetical protein
MMILGKFNFEHGSTCSKSVGNGREQCRAAEPRYAAFARDDLNQFAFASCRSPALSPLVRS